METILIVEDEVDLAQVLKDYLEMEGFETLLAHDGEAALKLFKDKNPSLVILDIMLPKKNGVEVLKEIRNTAEIPVIMLSAKNGEMDKVISLGAGADDYITKPFSPLELMARVKAQIRRYTSFGTGKKVTEGVVIAGSLKIAPESYEAWIEKEKIELTTKEFEMLYFFVMHLNQVFTREQIYEQVWGLNEYGDISSVAVYVKRLRKKMEVFGVDYIKTIWGVGYKMVVEEA